MCAWEILHEKEEEVKYDTVGTDITTLGRKLTLAFSFTRCEEAESPQPQSRHGFVPAPCEPAGREASAGSGDVAAPDRLSFPHVIHATFSLPAWGRRGLLAQCQVKECQVWPGI